jgi:hypothetical protein
VIGLEQGLALRDAGIRWQPRDGDHFAIPDRDLDDRVFVLSHMVVEVIDSPVGPLLAFNGTTEWALDSIEIDEVVWLPLEHQLRQLLGPAFVGLEVLPGDEPATRGYAVTIRLGDGGTQRHVDLSADAAYLRAVLALRRRHD